MRITYWAVAMVLFVFINMMPLHITLCQTFFQDNHQIKQEQCIFGSSDVIPRDIFNPDFAGGQPTYIFVTGFGKTRHLRSKINI